MSTCAKCGKERNTLKVLRNTPMTQEQCMVSFMLDLCETCLTEFDKDFKTMIPDDYHEKWTVPFLLKAGVITHK